MPIYEEVEGKQKLRYISIYGDTQNNIFKQGLEGLNSNYGLKRQTSKVYVRN